MRYTVDTRIPSRRPGATSAWRRAARIALAGALIGGLAVAPASMAASAAAPAPAAAPAVTLKVTATKVADPRYGDPLQLNVRSVSPTGEPVTASVMMNGTEYGTKELPAQFEIPTTGLQIGTSYRVDVDAGDGSLSGTAYERFTPQAIPATVIPSTTSIVYSQNLPLKVVANKPTWVAPNGWVRMPWGSSQKAAPVRNAAGEGTMQTSDILPGTYDVVMNFVDDPLYAPTAPGSGSYAGPLVVSRMPTKTTSLLSRTELTKGDSLETLLTVQSSVSGTTVPPFGIVSITATPAGGGSAIELRRIAVSDNRLLPVDLSSFTVSHTGDWVIRSRYEGTPNIDPSFSETRIRINEQGSPAAVTHTELQLSGSATPIGGAPIQATAKVTVDGGAAPTGAVVFLVDNVQFGAEVPVDAQGVARASLSPAAIGSHAVVARYIGTAAQAASSSPARNFSVEQASASITPSTAAAVAGDKLTIGVAAVDSSVEPSGTVTVSEGSSQLGAVAISSGRGTFTVPGLSPGGHELRLSYSGDANVSAAQTRLVLTVKALPQQPAKAKSSVKASFTKLSKHRVRAKVSVSASRPASGRVEIRYGSRVVAKGTLKAGAKSITLKTKKLKKGKRKLTIRYLGSSTVSGSSKSYTVRVR